MFSSECIDKQFRVDKSKTFKNIPKNEVTQIKYYSKKR